MTAGRLKNSAGVSGIGKVIAVISGKGGTGKTTTVAAISSCLAALGKKTLCIDCDAGLRNLDIALCMSDYAVSDFDDILSGVMEIDDAVRAHPLIENLFFLSAPSSKNAEEFGARELEKIFAPVRDKYDYCLVDSPSGVGAGFRLAVSGADMALVVATGELSSMRDAGRAAELASDAGISDLRLVINRVHPRDFKKVKSTLDDIIDAVGVRLIGVVREDKSIMHAPHENKPLVLYEKRRAVYNFLDTARRITGEDLPIRI